MNIEDDARDTGEPEGGWSAPSKRLYDTEIITLTLCKFTGLRLDPAVRACVARVDGYHADEDCPAVFFSAVALQRGELDITNFDAIPAEVRVPFAGAGEPTGTV